MAKDLDAWKFAFVKRKRITNGMDSMHESTNTTVQWTDELR